MKKVLIVLMTFYLILCINFPVLAERRIYATYEHGGEEADSGPAFGYGWDVNPLWLMAVEYQFDGSGNNDASLAAEVTRRVYLDTKMAFRIKLGDAINSYRFKLAAEQNQNLTFQFGESVSYTMSCPDSNASDYNQLELNFEIGKKLNNQFKLELDSTWTQVQYSAAKSSLDYRKLVITPKGRYLLGKQLELIGGYSWNSNTKTTGQIKNCCVVEVAYVLEDFDFYFQCKFPVAGNTSSLGVSYKF